MTVAFQRMFGILERWNNNQVMQSLSKPHELSYRSNINAFFPVSKNDAGSPVIQAGEFVGINPSMKNLNGKPILFVRASTINQYVESMKAELIELENREREKSTQVSSIVNNLSDE